MTRTYLTTGAAKVLAPRGSTSATAPTRPPAGDPADPRRPAGRDIPGRLPEVNYRKAIRRGARRRHPAWRSTTTWSAAGGPGLPVTPRTRLRRALTRAGAARGPAALYVNDIFLTLVCAAARRGLPGALVSRRAPGPPIWTANPPARRRSLRPRSPYGPRRSLYDGPASARPPSSKPDPNGELKRCWPPPVTWGTHHARWP
jgi:hypothetical protein